MSSSLIRGKYVVCGDGARGFDIVEDGGVLQRDGTIVAVGDWQRLARLYHPEKIYGSGNHIVMPGLINAHHHGGLLAFQMGTGDLPLEQWTVDRIRRRDVDPYLDTLYAACEMIESGVTAVQHLHSRASGPLEKVHRSARDILRAYGDAGMKVSYSFGVRDQNRLVYESDEAFLRRIPEQLGVEVEQAVLRQALPLEDHFVLFRQLRRDFPCDPRIRIQLAASNLQWCSDRALEMLAGHAEEFDVPVHMHLLETFVQREYARRRTGSTAVRHLGRLGLLGPRLTLAHVIWVTEGDIELIAATGTHVCHNPSSNLRLRSGVAPIVRFGRQGVRVSLGMDDASINDDRCMLDEMRMALRLHRHPGMDDVAIGSAQVLRMATENAALTTPFGQSIGSLQAGKAADMVLIDWDELTYPYLDSSVGVIDAVLHLARKGAVESVFIDGEPVLLERRHTRLDKAAAMNELARALRTELQPHERQRQDLAARLLPHVCKFYRDEGYDRIPAADAHLNCMNCRG